MNRQESTRVMWIAAAVAVAAGLAMSLRTSVRMKDDENRMEEYTRWAKQLREREDKAGLGDAAREAYDLLSFRQAVPIETVLSNSVPDQRYQLREIGTESAGGGWTARRVEVAFPDVEISKVAVFLTNAESNMPPWRVAECSIDSLGQGGGRGAVKVLLETLEKSEGGGFANLVRANPKFAEVLRQHQATLVQQAGTNLPPEKKTGDPRHMEGRGRRADRKESSEGDINVQNVGGQ